MFRELKLISFSQYSYFRLSTTLLQGSELFKDTEDSIRGHKYEVALESA